MANPEYTQGMRHYLIVTDFNGVTEFATFWADDEDHALEQLGDSTDEYNPRQYVTNIFVSSSEIENSTIDRLWPTEEVKDRINDEFCADQRVMFILNLKIGDEIFWNDPDNGISSGIYTIRDIHTESGIIESENDILYIANDEGSQAEVFAREIE